jgi:hypothetical protein
MMLLQACFHPVTAIPMSERIVIVRLKQTRFRAAQNYRCIPQLPSFAVNYLPPLIPTPIVDPFPCNSKDRSNG